MIAKERSADAHRDGRLVNQASANVAAPARLLSPAGALSPAGIFALLLALGIATVWCLILVSASPATHLPLLAVFVLAVPLFERFAIPSDQTGHTETATFALVIGAAATLGAGAGLLVAVIGLLVTANREGSAITSRLPFHAVLVLALVGGGAVLQMAPQATIPVVIFWMAFLAVVIQDCWRRGLAYKAGMIAIAIIGAEVAFVASSTAGFTPTSLQEYSDAIGSSMRFGVGFMTADTLAVSAIAAGRAGFSGLRFWRSELLPTFIRYNLMVAGGIAIALTHLIWGLPGVILGVVLVGAVVVWRYERDSARRRLVATICALTTALDARDPYTKGHSDRVAAYAVGIADKLGWSRPDRQFLEIAAHLHDVGKIGVRDTVLLKPGRLTDEEFAQIQTHSAMSSNIVRNIPDFHRIAQVIRQHHERLDGSGYPDAITEEEQLPAARILAVADVYDALTSDRAYRSAMSHEQALTILRSESGWKLDAAAVDALIALSEAEQLEGVLEYAYCLTH